MANATGRFLVQHLQPDWTVTVRDGRSQVARDTPSTSVVDGAAVQNIPGLTEATDVELVQACVAGHRRAFDQIMERHRRSIYQLCYRFVGNHEDASDLSQDIFVRAYKGLNGFKGRSSFGTWLYRIGVNVCLNRVTARVPPTEPIEAEKVVDRRSVDPADVLVSQEEAGRVRAAIARLPRKQRATLVLRVYQELSHEEIAGVLGSSVGAVKANFFHALGNLRKLLGDRAQ